MVPVRCAGKVMLTFFWDLPRSKTHQLLCLWPYCQSLLQNLWEKMQCERCRMLSRGVCLLQDNALTNAALGSITFAQRCGYESWANHYTHRTWHGEISSSSQSTSWTSFFWWPGLDYRRHGSRPRQKYISQEIRTLVKRWEKCIAVRGEYIERGLSSKMFQDRSTSVKGSVPWWRNGRSASHCGVHT